MVKEFLSQKGVPYKDFDVSRDRFAAQELVNKTGQAGVPVIMIDGQTVIGFDRAKLEQALRVFQRVSFGASIADASKILASTSGVPTPGAYVGKVRSGSAASRMGLAAGDIITEANTQGISNAGDLERVISGLEAGGRISVVFRRGDKQVAAEAVL
jgi:glutaredoxin 3